jgi:hypothetical protein
MKKFSATEWKAMTIDSLPTEHTACVRIDAHGRRWLWASANGHHVWAHLMGKKKPGH